MKKILTISILFVMLTMVAMTVVNAATSSTLADVMDKKRIFCRYFICILHNIAFCAIRFVSKNDSLLPPPVV